VKRYSGLHPTSKCIYVQTSLLQAISKLTFHVFAGPPTPNISDILLLPSVNIFWTMPHTNFQIYYFRLQAFIPSCNKWKYYYYYTKEIKMRYNYTVAGLIPGEMYEWQTMARSLYSSSYSLTRLPLRLGKEMFFQN